MATPQEILEQLKTIKYPGYTRDIVSFGIVRDIEVATAGITVTMQPGGANPESVAQIASAVKECVAKFTGAPVEVVFQAPEPAHGHGHGPARPATADIPGVRHVVAVASGKGGVGKSTVAVNLALALHSLGKRVGLLDADIYGPSVPMMLGLTERPRVGDDGRIEPLEKFGIKIISLGLFVAERTPVIWRGPMINKALTQFLREVAWGELDYLILDLPPGTGDAQLTVVQQVRLSGGVIVTTPQEVALLDVQRGITMFEQVKAPVLGVIENMSYHLCVGCGDRAEIFGHGGGEKMSRQFGIPLLGEIPLERSIREASDNGRPVVAAEPDGPHGRAFRSIAGLIVNEVEAPGRAEAGAPVIR